jgi:stress response protein YsnF
MPYGTTFWWGILQASSKKRGKAGKMTEQPRKLQVQGQDGLIGWIDPKEQSADGSDVLIRLENGQAVLAPKDLLVQKGNGYFLPLTSDQFQSDRGALGEDGQETLMVIPVLIEKAKVDKRLSVQPVRISKRVKERKEKITDTGYHEEVKVERIPINKDVKKPPKIRSEGNTTVVPILEEVLVVEKKIILREEVRITMSKILNEPQQFTLRTEDVEVERPQAGD